MKSILFKKLSYNITRITLSVLASVAVMTAAAYAASTIGTNFSADGTLSVTATSTLSSDLRVDTNTLVVDSFNDKVGIGTTSPYAKLSVVGETVSSYFTSTSTTATSTFAGGVDLTSSTGMGLNFGSNTLFYQNNQRFLTSSTTAAGNLTIGYQSATGLDANGGLYNTGVGYQALGNATSTDYNTALGYQALKGSATIPSAGYNTAVGYQALLNNTTGVNNTANGMQSLYSNTTGDYNIAIGVYSLNSNTTGTANVASGYGSLLSNTTGGNNVANGHTSLQVNTTGSANVASGYGSLKSNTTASNNTAYGHFSFYYNTTGAGNTGLGNLSGVGDNTTVDQRSVIDNYMSFIGYQASRDASIASTTVLTNGTAIGKNARVALSNSIVLGGTGADAVSVGIGTTTPQTRLHISSGASATTTVTIGELGLSTSKSCVNLNTNTGGAASFYIVGTTMVIEANYCR